jgi:hypothetical protein
VKHLELSVLTAAARLHHALQRVGIDSSNAYRCHDFRNACSSTGVSHRQAPHQPRERPPISRPAMNNQLGSDS